jgi:hypothetical protein
MKSSDYNLRFDSPGPNKKTRHISELDIKQNDESEFREIPIKNQISTKANAITKSSKTNINNNENSSNNNNNIINNSTSKNLQSFNQIVKENKIITQKSLNSNNIIIKKDNNNNKILSPESNQKTDNTENFMKNRMDNKSEKSISSFSNINKSKKSIDIKPNENDSSKISKIDNNSMSNKEETNSRKSTTRQLVNNENIRKDDSRILNISKKIRITTNNDNQSVISKQKSINSQKSIISGINKDSINHAEIAAEEVKNSFLNSSNKKGSKILDDDKSFKSEEISIKDNNNGNN